MKARTFTPTVMIAATLALGACGGGGPPPPEVGGDDSEGGEAPAAPKADGDTAESAEDAGEPVDENAPVAFPAKCKTTGEVCVPPVRFVKKLCGGFHPDAALALFAKETPFTRGYMARNVRAWNASGGASSDDELIFDEEVLIVHYRPAKTGGMQVSGAGGGYDVLRWDGTCATLSDGEVTLRKPPRLKNAQVTWKDLGDDTRAVFLADEKLKDINTKRKKECKGVSMGAVSKKCVQLVKKQSDLIVKHVRDGGDVHTPAQLE